MKKLGVILSILLSIILIIILCILNISSKTPNVISEIALCADLQEILHSDAKNDVDITNSRYSTEFQQEITKVSTALNTDKYSISKTMLLKNFVMKDYISGTELSVEDIDLSNALELKTLPDLIPITYILEYTTYTSDGTPVVVDVEGLSKKLKYVDSFYIYSHHEYRNRELIVIFTNANRAKLKFTITYDFFNKPVTLSYIYAD